MDSSASKKIDLAASCDMSMTAHLEAARKQKFNAVFVVHATASSPQQIKYLLYEFAITKEDCASTADFQASLYVYNKTKFSKKAAPVDTEAGCVCKKWYKNPGHHLVGCDKCGRWFHWACMFPGGSVSAARVAEICRAWECPSCCSAE